MNEITKQAAKNYALGNLLVESCAFIIIENGIEKFLPAKNISKEKHNHFIIAPESYIEAESRGQIIGIFHSHVSQPAIASQCDLVSCETTGVAWHIYSIAFDSWYTFYPKGYLAPLIGRTFKYGTLDCYSLVRDYYKQKLSIALPEFPRTDEDAFKKGQSLYLDNMEKAGFQVVQDLKENDVILMQLIGRVASHAAIYLGGNLILHHLRNRLSSRDTYGEYYRNKTVLFCRYFGVST